MMCKKMDRDNNGGTEDKKRCISGAATSGHCLLMNRFQ